jgi:hypothetical protein
LENLMMVDIRFFPCPSTYIRKPIIKHADPIGILKPGLVID